MIESNPFFSHNMEITPESSFKSIIKVIGVGGGGSNAVKHMASLEIKGADLIISNTDSQALASNPVTHKIKLGEMGLGAGTDPEVGKKAAIQSKEKIESIMTDETQMVFVTAGMGGGTGTGAAPVIAEIAANKGLLTVAVVTAPYTWEGSDKIQFARNGIEELKKYSDTVLVVLNDKLAQLYEDLPVLQAFEKADDVLAKAVKSVVDVIAKPGNINTDFMDVKKVLTKAGQALMSSATGSGQERALSAISQALDSPLLNSQEIKGAKRILITVSTSTANSLRMSEQNIIIDYVMKRVNAQANMVKFGFSSDESLGEDLYLTIIAAGFENEFNTYDLFFPHSNSDKNEWNNQVTEGVLFQNDENGSEETDEVKFTKLVEAYYHSNILDNEISTPTYQRNKINLVDINRLPKDKWKVSEL